MTGAPKKVYVEHSALVHEAGWNSITKLFGPASGARVVASDWNLIEIASGADRAQVTRRAEFLDSLRPLWMMERVRIQEREIRNFMWESFYGTAGLPVEVFSPHLSVMLSYNLGSRAPLGATARSYVLGLFADRRHLNEIHAQKRQNVDALRKLQKATKMQKRAYEPKIFRLWVSALVPNQTPDGKLLTSAEKKYIADS